VKTNQESNCYTVELKQTAFSLVYNFILKGDNDTVLSTID